MAIISRNVHARAPFLRKVKDVKWIGLVATERNDMWNGITDIGPYRQSYEGIYSILSESHLPVDVLTEDDLQDPSLSDYAVLILPSQHCLSDASITTLKDYVRKGGGLVASNRTSLWDDMAVRREDFALADVFGCSYVDDGVEGNQMFTEIETRHPVFAGPEIADCIITRSFHGLMGLNTEGIAFVKTAEGIDVAHVTEDYRDPLRNRSVMTMVGCMGRIVNTRPTTGTPIGFRIDDNPEFNRTSPIAYANTYGNGKVVFFPMDIGRMYTQSSYPQWRIMIERACRHVASQPPSIEADAPMAIQFEPTWQPEENRYVVHLLNDSLPNLVPQESPYRVRQDSIPVAGIKVRLRGMVPSEAYAEPGHEALKIARTDEGSVIELAVLREHVMIVFPGQEGPR